MSLTRRGKRVAECTLTCARKKLFDHSACIRAGLVALDDRSSSCSTAPLLLDGRGTSLVTSCDLLLAKQRRHAAPLRRASARAPMPAVLAGGRVPCRWWRKLTFLSRRHAMGSELVPAVRPARVVILALLRASIRYKHAVLVGVRERRHAVNARAPTRIATADRRTTHGKRLGASECKSTGYPERFLQQLISAGVRAGFYVT